MSAHPARSGGVKRLVLVGAGHAHVEVLRRFAAQPPDGTSITVVTRGAATAYTGMLPGMVAGHYRPADLAIPVEPLARRAGAALVIGEARGLDPAAGRLEVAGVGAIGFDLLSLDIGAAPKGVPASERALPVKPMERFPESLRAAERRLVQPGGSVAVVGGGVGGVEIALALHHRWRGRGLAIELIERGPDILKGMPEAVRRRILVAFAEKGVAVRTGQEPECGHDLQVWATGVEAPRWLEATGLALDERGFVAVDPFLRSLSHGAVFAAGDVAGMAEAPRPKAGVIAVRQGPVLAENLRAALAGGRLKAFRPQKQWLTLIATGPRHAVGTRNGVTVSGGWVWRWKDWIDRSFVARYRPEGGPV